VSATVLLGTPGLAVAIRTRRTCQIQIMLGVPRTAIRMGPTPLTSVTSVDLAFHRQCRLLRQHQRPRRHRRCQSCGRVSSAIARWTAPA
jgi:hypothetical protein